MSNELINEKARGAMLSFAIGDALGWPFENVSKNLNRDNNQVNGFLKWVRRVRSPFWHDETVGAGEYSDDTQLVLAVGRSLLSENWVEHLKSKELPFWLTYERGGGRAILKAARGLCGGDVSSTEDLAKEYFAAGGNGGVMRILPHIIYHSDGTIEDIIDEVVEDVIISHGHPRAILGAACYTFAVHYLLQKDSPLSFAELAKVLHSERKRWGAAPNKARFSKWLDYAKSFCPYDFNTEWNRCYIEMRVALGNIISSLDEGFMSDDSKILESIGTFSKAGGAGDVSTLTAIYLFSKYVNAPELALGISAHLKDADTDTIAALTGGLLGAILGTEWIPYEWRNVQDWKYISALADSLVNKENSIGMDKIADSNCDSPIGKMKLISQVSIPSRYSIIKIEKYMLEYGQSIYIKSFSRKENIIDSENYAKHKKAISVMLNYTELRELTTNPLLSRITFRKVLQVLLGICEGKKTEEIAHVENVSKETVELLASYMLDKSEKSD